MSFKFILENIIKPFEYVPKVRLELTKRLHYICISNRISHSGKLFGFKQSEKENWKNCLCVFGN